MSLFLIHFYRSISHKGAILTPSCVCEIRRQLSPGKMGRSALGHALPGASPEIAISLLYTSVHLSQEVMQG